MSVKLRRDTVANDSVYFILGIDEEGYREVLDSTLGQPKVLMCGKKFFTLLRKEVLLMFF